MVLSERLSKITAVYNSFEQINIGILFINLDFEKESVFSQHWQPFSDLAEL